MDDHYMYKCIEELRNNVFRAKKPHLHPTPPAVPHHGSKSNVHSDPPGATQAKYHPIYPKLPPADSLDLLQLPCPESYDYPAPLPFPIVGTPPPGTTVPMNFPGTPPPATPVPMNFPGTPPSATPIQFCYPGSPPAPGAMVHNEKSVPPGYIHFGNHPHPIRDCSDSKTIYPSSYPELSFESETHEAPASEEMASDEFQFSKLKVSHFYET